MSTMGSLKRRSNRDARITQILGNANPGDDLTDALNDAIKDEKTYWNGEETPCRRVMVVVGKPEKPTWWCAELEGTIREAVEISYTRPVRVFGNPDASETGKFYIDNENGSGWLKVTRGFGGPEWGHKSLPVAEVLDTPIS